MNRSTPNEMEPGVQTRKMPQDNPEVWQGIRELLEDPVAYLAREREASLRDAEEYVNRRMDEMRAEEKAARAQRRGQLVLRLLGRDRDKATTSQ